MLNGWLMMLWFLYIGELGKDELQRDFYAAMCKNETGQFVHCVNVKNLCSMSAQQSQKN